MAAQKQAPWWPLVAFATGAADSGDRRIDPLLLAKLDALMGVPWQRRDRPPSALNNDGSPLELCLSASAKGISSRLIGDPHLGLPMARRVPASLAAARHLMRLTRSTILAAAFDLLVAHTVPPAPRERAALPNGALCLACSIDEGTGFAAYTNLEWCGGKEERWHRARTWLGRATSGFVDATLAAWRNHWTPFAAGLEGDRPDRAHVKLYLRRADDTSFCLDMLGDLYDPVVDTFCRGVIQGRTLPVSGIVLSTEFAVQTGRLTGMKVDICGHCTPRPTSDWQVLTASIAATARLSPLSLDDLVPAIDVAFIGIGRRSDQNYRLNLYLKHPRQVS